MGIELVGCHWCGEWGGGGDVGVGVSRGGGEGWLVVEEGGSQKGGQLSRRRSPYIAVKRCVSWMKRNKGCITLGLVSRYCSESAFVPRAKCMRALVLSCTGQSSMK